LRRHSSEVALLKRHSLQVLEFSLGQTHFISAISQTTDFSYLLKLLEDGRLAADYPSEVLAVLNATIPQDVPFLSGGLTPLLNIIQEANPALSIHPHFTRLTVLSQQHEN